MTTKLENVCLETLAHFHLITEWFRKFQGQMSKLARYMFWGIVFLMVRIIIQRIMKVYLSDKSKDSDEALYILIIMYYSDGYSGSSCGVLGVYRQFKLQYGVS